MLLTFTPPAKQAATSYKAGARPEPLISRRARLADNYAPTKRQALCPIVVRGSARGIEFALVALLGLAVARAYVQEVTVLQHAIYLLAAVSVAATTVLMFELLSLYSIASLSAHVRNMPHVALGWTAAFAALVASIFFLKIGAEVSRVWLAVWYAAGAVALLATRVFIGWYLRAASRTGRLYQRAAIYGTGQIADELIGQFEADTKTNVRIAGIFDDRDDDRLVRHVRGYPRKGGLDDLVSLSRRTRLDLVIVALPLSAEKRLENLARRLSVLPADVKMPAQSSVLRFSPRTYSRVGNVAMIDLYDSPITGWGHIAKWLFDKIIAAIALVMLVPVMALIAIAVKLDSKGPVFFRQKRYGFNNELIEVFKFRSMYVDRCDAAASALVTKDDLRVTRVGRLIRKTSLDELPQLLNVLFGDLSLVGPRPHAVQAKAGRYLYDEVVEGYFARHKVKPGITGWAQINGWRGETDTELKIAKRVEHDLFYIENWSVFFDLYIVLKTPAALFNTSNAY